MEELDKLITEIEAVENMYLDKKQVLKRLKAISKMETNGGGIPYDAFSDEFKRSIDSIENALSKRNKQIQLGDFSANDLKHIAEFRKVVKNYMRMKEIEDETEIVICNRVNRTDNNRCINCGAKTGHECQMKPDKSNYC